MTLQQLEYVLALDRHRHFGKAAEECHVTQPTLSAMIQKLEEELDTRIFDRTRQPVCPTAAGQIVIGQAREVVRQAGRIRQLVNEERGIISGTFRLGILPTIAPYLLPRFFPQLMDKDTQIDMQVTEMKTADIKQALRNGELDAGIVASLAGMEDFAQTPLFYEQFFAYVSPKDKLAGHTIIRTADLADKQLWLLDEGHCFRDQLVRFCQLKAAQASQQTYRLGSMETFMRMVESGKGVTFIPELAVEQLNEWQKGLVRPFAVPTPTRQIVMLTRTDFIRQRLLDIIRQEIQASVPAGMRSANPTQQVI